MHTARLNILFKRAVWLIPTSYITAIYISTAGPLVRNSVASSALTGTSCDCNVGQDFSVCKYQFSDFFAMIGKPDLLHSRSFQCDSLSASSLIQNFFDGHFCSHQFKFEYRYRTPRDFQTAADYLPVRAPHIHHPKQFFMDGV